MELTARQTEILRFIRKSIVNGKSPSVRDIMSEFGFSSPNGAWGHLNALKDKGVITWSEGECRTIRLAGESPYDVLRDVKKHLAKDFNPPALELLKRVNAILS